MDIILQVFNKRKKKKSVNAFLMKNTIANETILHLCYLKKKLSLKCF